jgi:hypothetical protein
LITHVDDGEAGAEEYERWKHSGKFTFKAEMSNQGGTHQKSNTGCPYLYNYWVIIE